MKELRRVRQTYAFIKASRRQHSVPLMCEVLEDTPSGYYEWLKPPLSNRAQEDARLLRFLHGKQGRRRSSKGLPRPLGSR